MDEAAQIDLALNTDFDPSLFDCWDDNVTTGRPDENQCKDDDGINKANDPTDPITSLANGIPESATWDHPNGDKQEYSGYGNIDSQHTSTPQFVSTATITNTQVQSTSSSASGHGIQIKTEIDQSTSTIPQSTQNAMFSIGTSVERVPSIMTQSGTAQLLSLNPSSSNMAQQNHYMVQTNQQQNQQNSFAQNYQHSQTPLSNQVTGTESKFQHAQLGIIPNAFSTTFPNPMSYYILPQQQHVNQQGHQQQNVNALPGATAQSQQSQMPTMNHQPPQIPKSFTRKNDGQHQKHTFYPQGESLTETGARGSSPYNASVTSRDSSLPQLNQATPEQVSTREPNLRGRKNVQQDLAPTVASKSSTDLPPFLLFDAPIELRANFIQSQRQHGIPPMQDNNSVHYGLIVNGFHPQQSSLPNSQDRPDLVSRGTISTTNSSGQVRLIDGRHGSIGNKRVKNAREQKRTQKITDLIDELRVKMERGGWKVGLKSKFHTLSSCAEYVKHLVQVNEAKEEALKKARADLETKRKTMDEDDKAEQDPSDPESTTSSLTVSTSSVATDRQDRSSGNSKAASKGNFNESNSGSSNGNSGPNSDGSGPSDETQHWTNASKKSKFSSHESSLSSSTSSGGEGSGKQNYPQGISVGGAMGASVSDLTDSNKGGSSEGHCSGSSQSALEQRQDERKEKGEERSVGGTVSSDAAVARGQDNHGHVICHADVVVTKIRKRKIPNSETLDDSKPKARRDYYEPTSIDYSFQLDYEEVFLKSNVPQILATTSGRIVAWNDFFLKITGLKAEEASRLTFFSLVPSNRLSSLFEIVAAALRSGSHQMFNEDNLGSVSSNVNTIPTKSTYTSDATLDAVERNLPLSSETSKWNYSAITLPCVSFETTTAHTKRRRLSKHVTSETDKPDGDKEDRSHKDSKQEPRNLFITVTLMPDEDPRKRCFHCVFTDCPGTNGSLGAVTPELLSLLFSDQLKASATEESAHYKRKRVGIKVPE